MFSWISAILQFISAIKWLMAEFKKYQIAEKAKELNDAVDKAVKTGDQRELEKAIGSDNAGKPTHENLPDLKEREHVDHGSTST